MMKHYFLILIFFGFIHEGIAQNKISTSSIKYDFETKDLNDFKPVKLGNAAVLKIKNINRFLYDVTITAKQVEYYTEAPLLWSQVFNIEVPQAAKAEGEAEKILLNQNTFRNGDDSDTLHSFYIESLQLIQVKAETLDQAYYNLEEIKILKNRLIYLSLDEGLTHSDAKSKSEDILKDYPDRDNLEILKLNFNIAYNQFMLAYKTYCEDENVQNRLNNDDIVVRSRVALILAEAESIKASYNEYNYSKLFKEINILVNELNKASTFYIVSDPVQAKKDVINFNIKITPKEGVNTNALLENRDFSVSAPIVGGLKIDFSTGFIYSNNLYDRNYSTSADSLSTQISEDKYVGVGQIAVGAMMHVSKRTTKIVKPALSIGIGIPLTDQARMNIYAGVGMMMGNSQKFVISGGLALGNVEYLKGKYTTDTDIENSKIDSELTEKVLKTGWFISLSYNLTNKEKE